MVLSHVHGRLRAHFLLMLSDHFGVIEIEHLYKIFVISRLSFIVIVGLPDIVLILNNNSRCSFVFGAGLLLCYWYSRAFIAATRTNGFLHRNRNRLFTVLAWLSIFSSLIFLVFIEVYCLDACPVAPLMISKSFLGVKNGQLRFGNHDGLLNGLLRCPGIQVRFCGSFDGLRALHFILF